VKLKVGDIIIYKGILRPAPRSSPSITPLALPGTIMKIVRPSEHSDSVTSTRWDVVALFGEITHDTPILHIEYDDFEIVEDTNP
jgi:hypothetical protein